MKDFLWLPPVIFMISGSAFVFFKSMVFNSYKFYKPEMPSKKRYKLFKLYENAMLFSLTIMVISIVISIYCAYEWLNTL